MEKLSSVSAADEQVVKPSWVVQYFGRAGELTLGIAGLAIGSVLGLASFLWSKSEDVALLSSIFCVAIFGLTAYASIQTWVMRQSVIDVRRAFEQYEKSVDQYNQYKRGIHESDKIFRQLQERRSQLDQYFLEISKYRSIKNGNASREILDYLVSLCNYCNRVIAVRNNLPTELFSTNIKTIFWKDDEAKYDTLVRCANTPPERRDNPNTQFAVASHAVFDKLIHDYRKRHIIRDLSDYLRRKRPNIKNGTYTGPSSNALKYYGSSICVAIFDINITSCDDKFEPQFSILSNIEASTSIESLDGHRIYGFLSIDTSSMVFNYENDDINLIRELAIPAKSAIKLLQAIQTINNISLK
jgi:hypothetical protein